MLIKGISQIVLKFFTKNPTKVQSVGKRLGVATASPNSLAAMAAQNPVTAALIALEMGQAGHAILEMMNEELPEEERQSILFALPEIDAPPRRDIAITDLHKYADELADIKDVIRLDGGLEEFKKRRRVALMDDSLVELFLQVRELGVR